MKSTFYTDDHEAYRESVREFLRREVEPHHERWRREHGVDRAMWEKAGAHGMLGLGVPEEFGGGGEPDYRYRFVFAEEIARTGFTSFGVGIGLQDDIVIPYFLDLATPEQKERWADAEVVAAAQDDPRTWPALRARLSDTFATRTRDEWAEVFDGSDACVTPVLSFAEAAAHPHLTARGTLVEADGVVQAAPAPRFSRTRAPGIRPPRSMPDDVADVLADWAPTGATDLPTERQETR